MEEQKEKKQKVLHTRVSEPLERALKEKAADLGLSVSTMVRNLLTNTVDLVEEVVVDSARVADSARGVVTPGAEEPWPPRPDKDGPQRPARVMGWQRIRLSLNAICPSCNAILPSGAKAAISVLDAPGKRTIICGDCLDRVCPRPLKHTGEEDAT